MIYQGQDRRWFSEEPFDVDSLLCERVYDWGLFDTHSSLCGTIPDLPRTGPSKKPRRAVRC